MPSYIPNSTRLGSTMIMRTSSGVALYMIDMIIELIMTLLPEPVDPAIKQVGHGFERCHANPAVDILAERNGQVRMRLAELVGFQHLPQRNQFAPGVGNLDAHRRLAGNALDQDRFRLQPQAQIFGEVNNAAVLHPGVGLEFESRDHRTRIDLHHVAEHVELFELALDLRGDVFQFLLVIGVAPGDLVQ